MKNYQTLEEILPALNDMLLQERIAITLLDLEALSSVQQEKGELLAMFDQIDKNGSSVLEPLLAEVQANNDRNQHLLKASMALFGRMRQRLLGQMAPTYGAAGISSTPLKQSRLLAGAV